VAPAYHSVLLAVAVPFARVSVVAIVFSLHWLDWCKCGLFPGGVKSRWLTLKKICAIDSQG
jgi:hypothetical protein